MRFLWSPSAGPRPLPFQPTKQLLSVHFVDVWRFMYLDDELLNSIGFIESLIG